VGDAYIVDTGVFLRWFIDQPGSEHALQVRREFLTGTTRLETVDFARVEVAEVLRKKGLAAGRLDRMEFLTAVRVIDDLGVVIHGSDPDRVRRAADLAARLTLRMFDALFVQVALDRGLPILTTDFKLCKAVNRVVMTELLRGIAPA
jgi:predicted nucleic acid-binding protein